MPPKVRDHISAQEKASYLLRSFPGDKTAKAGIVKNALLGLIE